MNYAKQLENVTRERTIKPSVFNQENSYSLRAITGEGVILMYPCHSSTVNVDIFAWIHENGQFRMD